MDVFGFVHHFSLSGKSDMAIKPTNRRNMLEGGGVTSHSAARAREGSEVVHASVDATRAASQSAHGVPRSEKLRAVEARVAIFQRVASSDIAQTVDTAALEIKTILGRMRQIAVRGATHPMSGQDRSVLQDEFAMLAAEIDRVALLAEASQGARSELGSDGVDELRPADGGVFKDDFIAQLTSRSLGVSPGQAAVDTPEEAEWALFRIDTADKQVLKIRDEFGTVEERMDSALASLEEFVKTNFPGAERHGPPSEVIRAAERIRLELMHQDGS